MAPSEAHKDMQDYRFCVVWFFFEFHLGEYAEEEWREVECIPQLLLFVKPQLLLHKEECLVRSRRRKLPDRRVKEFSGAASRNFIMSTNFHRRVCFSLRFLSEHNPAELQPRVTSKVPLISDTIAFLFCLRLHQKKKKKKSALDFEPQIIKKQTSSQNLNLI